MEKELSQINPANGVITMQQLEMVFNELSLGTSVTNQTVATDKQKARELMSIFLNTLSTAVNCGVKTLRTQIDIYSIMLAPSYPVANWVNDTQVDEAEQTFLLTLETERPLLSNLKDPKIENQINLFECQHNGNEANGLGIAYLLEALAVSLCSEAIWDCSCLTLDITQINDESGDLIEENIEIVHASRSEHIKQNNDWIKNRIRTAVRDGVDLWQRRDELFPNLEFCDAVEPQVCSLLVGYPMLTQVTKRLFELEAAAKSWTAGIFDLKTIPSKATPESDSRLQEFSNQLTILCLDGTDRLFSLHLRMTPGAWRLYFFPLNPEKSKKIIVGYIGQKIL